MAPNNVIKRYLDTGVAFTQMTQARAEAIVRDLVRAGELQSEQRQAAVRDLLDRSRKNTEKLVSQVRQEARDQVSSLGLATKADIHRLERQIAALKDSRPARSTAGAKSPAKRAAATKSPAKRAAATKSPAKRAAATKSPAKRAAATKRTAKKGAATKRTAKKAPAKKATSR